MTLYYILIKKVNSFDNHIFSLYLYNINYNHQNIDYNEKKKWLKKQKISLITMVVERKGNN